jgi:hypothetical protein
MLLAGTFLTSEALDLGRLSDDAVSVAMEKSPLVAR